MVRTKADGAGRKAAGAKAPRKQVGGSSSAASSFGSPTSKYGGGNPVKWWPSPKWQKGIGDFFSKENPGNEISPDKAGPSNATEHPGVSSMEQGIEAIEED